MDACTAMAAVVRFAEPWWLAALAGACVPPAAAYLAARRGRRVSGLSVAMQCAAVAMIALALARPELPLGERADRPYLVLRDASASVRAQDGPLAWPEGLPREDLQFAATVLTGRDERLLERTNLAPALRLAAARGDDAAGVVIVTDGQFHDDWQAAASQLALAAKPVAIVPLDSPPADARVAQVTARRRRAGPRAAIDLRVTVASGSAQARLLNVSRRSPPKEFPPRMLNLCAGDTVTAHYTDDDPPTDRAVVYVASLAGPADAFPENDRLSAVVLPDRLVLAWVAAGNYRRAEFEKSLAATGVEVRAVAPAEAPNEAAGWSDFAAVVLVEGEGPNQALGRLQREALAAYVRSGGGLLQLGSGPHKTPDDRNDPVNRVAALVANPYERKPLRVIVVLDASGSMDEQAGEGPPAAMRFDLAAQAVMALQRHLTGEDSLAVITFSDAAALIYDSERQGSGGIDFGLLHQALKRVRPGGRTIVLPAIERAAGLPRQAQRDELVLLVSDLLTERFDVQRAADLFAGGRPKLAVVVINPPGGPEPAQAPLRQLAEKLNAPLTPATELSRLAEAFVAFITETRGEALRRGAFSPAAPGGEVLGLDVRRLGKLKAYYLSAPQQKAEVLMRIDGDPIMAVRPAGLGRVVSLVVPVSPGDQQDPGAGRLDELLAAAARQVLRTTDLPGFSGSAQRRDGRVHIELSAYDPNRADGQWPADGLRLTASVLSGEEEASPLSRAELLQTAPGRYEAEVPAGEGQLGVVIRDAEGRTVWQDSLAGGYGREFAYIAANYESLRRLAEITGGEISPAPALEKLARQWDRKRYSPVWAYAIAAGAALMLLDWAAARILRRA